MQDEHFLARSLRMPVESLNSERRRELLEAAAVRSRRSSRSAWQRLRANSWPLVQTAVAAGISYEIAANVLGHPSPFFAPVAAIVALGATRGQRSQRAVELMLGVALGIGLGELLMRAIGIGVGQLVLTVGIAMAAATMLGAGPGLLTEAAVSATLVATVQPGTKGFLPTRLLDALIGGTVALVFSQVLFPVHPVRIVRQAADSVLRELSGALDQIAQAIDRRDQRVAEQALLKARRVSSDWSRFEQALDIGEEAAQYSPTRRRHREPFEAVREVGLPLDLLVRDIHVLARGAVRALTIGDPLPVQLSEALRDLSRATVGLADEIGSEGDSGLVRPLALRAVYRASALAPTEQNVSLSLLVGYTQASAADLLRALGMEREPAHERIGETVRAAAR